MAIRSSGVSLATGQVLVERHPMERAAALLVVSRASEVHEHAAHQARGHREKVRAILPLDAANINQLEVDLVDEGGGLQHVVRTLAGHVPLGDALELAVHEREQLLDGPVVAGSPFDEEGGHVVGSDVGQDTSLTPRHSTPPPGLTAVFLGLRLPPHSAASGRREGRREDVRARDLS